MGVPNVAISPPEWAIIKNILERHVPQYEVWAFGSRAKWTSKEYSDLDLAIITDKPLSLATSAALTDDFSESDLPYKVDVVDWATTSESFRKIIERDKVVLQGHCRCKATSPEWTETRLEDITTVLGDGLHGTPEYDDHGDYYFINGNNLSDGRIIFNDNTRRVSEAEYIKHRKNLNDRTILVSINGTLGNVALYCGEKVVLGKSACYFNVCKDVDKQFVRYVIASELFQNYIHTLATGSTIKNVSLRLMRDFSLHLPTLEEQQRISAVLVALDDRINLLRETNATLEAIAQALFKSWFVDFDPVQAKAEGQEPEGIPPEIADMFPSEFEDSPLGEIPKGWKVSNFGELTNVAGGGTPSTKEPAYWDEGIHYWVTPKDLSGKDTPVLFETERKITDAGLGKISSGLLPKGTLLMSSRAPIGYLAIAEVPVAINQGFIAMKPKEGISNLFLLNLIRSRMDEIKNHANGSTFMEISKAAFRPIPIIAPPIQVIQAYDLVARSLHDRLVENQRQIGILTTLRDALLPKLMQGKLRVTAYHNNDEAMA